MPLDAPFIAIVGAGPAGLAAAEILSAAGARVAVYDRMPSVARKFLMAGRGGLNLTHSEPLARFLTRYGKAAERLAPALEAFPPDALRQWALGLGEETFVGSSGRVFPLSFKASPLLRAWLARLSAQGVAFHLRHAFRGWSPSGAVLFDTPDGAVEEKADAVLLALGGASWPRLGSDGSWVEGLRAAGVPVNALSPSNMGVSIGWSEVFRARFAGTPLKRIALRFGKTVVRGEAVVTASGLEGGAIYALSADLRRALGHRSITLHLDLRPDLDEKALAARLAAAPVKASFSTVLAKHGGLAPVAANLVREVAGPARPDAAALARLIKALPLEVTGHAGLERAISTAGGIAWSAVGADYALCGLPAHLPPVFAAGEMLDWEAPTGGYLLQACFSTGRAAAEGIKARLNF
ncbi:TIGR03862 family flavoprotein [Xanthobacter autotrophicus]|uniref:TIGR03862 family flavoprotein n=1 Tax=Xanthobacter TaxID=279 RepID=UPI0024AB4F69|nr:TIGR03862 family flavoprotein [Xanthobacter autotrophicus]MDI4666959.1 TIGR03862 family flavoprotein [Xanthobacter autotrophicus]